MQTKQQTTSSMDKQLKAASAGSDTSSTRDSATQSRFVCYLATKSSKLCQYELDINEVNLSIISSSKQKIKSTLNTMTTHVKEIPKQPRETDDNDLDIVEEGKPKVQLPAQSVSGETEESKQLFWYPIKLVLPKNKSRTVFTETRKARKELISAVLAVQGFSNPLD